MKSRIRIAAICCLACAGWLSWPARAAAFPASQHRSVTAESCKGAGLPADFCKRTGVEAYNTDAIEWDDPLAHAQMLEGVLACESANDLMARLAALGGEFRARVNELEGSSAGASREELAAQIARALGRAMHTVQDNRAHHGMPNPEHAWYSLQDFCQGTTNAPDLRPGSLDEARAATDIMMARVAEAIEAAGIASVLATWSCPSPDPNEPNAQDVCTAVQTPAPWELCSFLAESKVWDGVDNQWDADRIEASMVEAFWTSATSDMCQQAPLTVEPAAPVDTSGGIPTCAKAHLACFGKVDDPSLQVSEPTPAVQDPAAPESASGCGVASRNTGAPWAGILLFSALAFAARRRRKA